MAILVAYDGSDPARKAVTRAFDEYPDEEHVLLRVVEAAGGSTGAGINLAQEALKDMREETSNDVEDHVDDLEVGDDVDYRTEIVVGDPAREVVEYAEEEDNDVDHIFVGSHGRSGVSRVLLGSVAEKIVRRAPVPVTVVR
ncbi:Nucleotide-binding universal stress protein, UspA family [Halobiforma haloterrestris]|uniref:Nucleotide-binding universal stress protein, UspA family n=1 Tax=Natronobacterium haloterrestre TaxID=148448 RepID=A0A1I1HMG5_NATHA|nr:universal stress protein [Halobiforma haloterrestris]SFC25319.1 Nucleotide-binding universal stress protein, UspA family [Halobiforma haloterrestris]